MPESVALSIHGPAGVLDLVVPAGATAQDVAASYAQEAGLGAIPLLQTPLGKHLVADLGVEQAGLRSGDVLVAVLGLPRTRPESPDHQRESGREGRAGVIVVAVAAAVLGVLAGWFAARSGDPEVRLLVAGCLVGSALLTLVPLGHRVRERSLVAPAFGASAAYAMLAAETHYQPPAVVAACGLVAAAVAATARVWVPGPGGSQSRSDGSGVLGDPGDGVEDGLLVWMVAGLTVAAVCGAAVLLEVAPQVPWALLLAGGVLAARLGPSYAVDVPDEALLDLERLAVTAWSARDEQPGRGRRGRMVVPETVVRQLVRRGSRLVTGIALAVLVVVLVAAAQLLAATTVDVDLVGARALLFFGGGALLLAARSYRHVTARVLLQLSGLWCLVLLAVDLFQHGSDGLRYGVLAGAVLIGLVCVVVAVATGRGWRSVWWSRRAEVAETLCGTLAIASTAVATGVVRHFWEMNS